MASPPLPTGAARREDARGSTRTCVGCQARFASGPHALTPADMHVRVVLGPAAPDGSAKVAVDLAGKAVGRGAHLHARPDCLERACRGGLARAFKRPIAASPRDLAEQIARAAEQRIRGLLLGARRAQLVAFGDEAREKLQRGTAVLALVAVDAGASGTKGALLGAVRDGKVLAFGTKADLGVLFGRDEVALVAITHPGVAAQIHCARAAADAVSVLTRS